MSWPPIMGCGKATYSQEDAEAALAGYAFGRVRLR